MSKKENTPSKPHWRDRIFDSLSFPTLILNTEQVILDANNVFLEKYGDKEDIIGRKCYDFFYNSKVACTDKKCPFKQVFAEKTGASILVKEFDDEGTEKWEDRVFSPILDEKGEVKYVRESIRDVTQVKILEKELKGVKNIMEKVVQSSASGIVAANMKGGVILMNKAAEDLFGYSFEKFIHTNTVEEFYPPGVAKDIMKKLRSDEYGGKGKLNNIKVDIINSSGERIPGEIAAAIIYEDDVEVATTGIYTDLRQKIAADRKLKETQEMLAQSEKMASIGQLAAGVAHEINNPLTGILFSASMMLESCDRGDPQQEDLECIIEDVNRCKEIVKDLLIYSRQTSSAKDFIQLNILVNQSLSLIRDQKVFGHITIEKMMSDEPMLINVDRNQFNQVVINLVMNAVDTMAGNGILSLKTYRDKAAKKVFLEISDTGGGISEKDLPKIFDPFYTTKNIGKGTGLGLSTAYGIVKENDGHILVKETGPSGTTFLIELPLYQSLKEP